MRTEPTRESSLNDISSFAYVTKLLKHADELAAYPVHWMPWNYRNTLLKLVRSRNG